MKVYIYNGKEYDTWDECKKNFPNVSFPVLDRLTEEFLNKFGITTEEKVDIEKIKQSLVEAVQKHMDIVTQTRNYDSIASACSYYNSSVPKFKAEAEACTLWRDAVWSYCYAQLDLFEKGEREVPTVEELINELPALEW